MMMKLKKAPSVDSCGVRVAEEYDSKLFRLKYRGEVAANRTSLFALQAQLYF